MTMNEEKIADVVHQIALQGFQAPARPPIPSPDASEHAGLSKLQQLGSQLWVDTGDRDKALSVWRKGLSALTTNNTLANQVVQTGVMDDAIRETVTAIRGQGLHLNDEEMIMEIGFVINCKIALRLVSTFHTKVSVELHPSMARDMSRSLSYAHRYYRVNPEHFIIKIPLTPEGYLTVRHLAQEGIPVNFTLGFSVRQNVLAARLSNPEYVNVFLGRLNAVVKDNGLGDGQLVGEKVTWATQSAIERLRREHPGTKTHLIGASIRDGAQVVRLAGLDVLTIPPGALQEFLDMNLNPADLKTGRDQMYPPGILPSGLPRLQSLWELDPEFLKATEALLKKNPSSLQGEDIISCYEDHGVPLFHRFTEVETVALQKHGKIPRIGAWPDSLPIDDLMTQSALQSFAVDQQALDARIGKFLS